MDRPSVVSDVSACAAASDPDRRIGQGMDVTHLIDVAGAPFPLLITEHELLDLAG